MRKIKWFLRWLLCWTWGHTGQYFDSGYHVCARCGLHGYWSYRETSGMNLLFEYGNAGWLWSLCERMRNWRCRDISDDELPF